MFKNMRVATRLAIGSVAVVIGLVSIAAMSVSATKRDAIAAHQQRLKNLVEIGIGIVENYQKLEAGGQLTRDEAQSQAKEALRNPRFSKNDYYFIYDFDARALMVAGKPSLEGQVMLGKTDAKGYKLWDRFIEVVKGPGSGFVEYWFPRADQTVPKPKLSYVAKVPGWDWLVGTGVYIDDVDEAVNQVIIQFSIVAAIIMIATSAIGLIAAHSIVTQLGGEPPVVAEYMKRIANGDLAVNVEVKESDKDSLTASLKLMQMKLVNLTNSIQESAAALSEQVKHFEGAAQLHVETRSDESLAETQRSVKRLGKTADVLKKAIARFKL